jgi:hypothetical protein
MSIYDEVPSLTISDRALDKIFSSHCGFSRTDRPRPKDAILIHFTNLLKKYDGLMRSLIDGRVKNVKIKGSWEIVSPYYTPVVFEVYGVNLLDSETLDVKLGISPLGDTPIRFSARITYVTRRVRTFYIMDDGDTVLRPETRIAGGRQEVHCVSPSQSHLTRIR